MCLFIFLFFFCADIKECAMAVNANMLQLVSRGAVAKSEVLDLNSVMDVLRQYLAHSRVDTKVAALKWIHHLFTEVGTADMEQHSAAIFPVLLSTLFDTSDDVVLQGLVVLAEIVNSSTISKGSNNTKKKSQLSYFHIILLFPYL